MLPSQVRLFQERHQENLELMLKDLFIEERLSDVTLHCKDGTVRAHKVILAASSSYFRKIFEEHPEHQVAFLVHGASVDHLRGLLELMYKGSTEISTELADKLCDIADDFGLKGVVDDKDSKFKDQKRVVVDFDSSPIMEAKQIKCNEELDSSIKEEPDLSSGPILQLTPEARRRNSWALKQRKYKCALCPASFKRASHLTRHQLVHTGERPYACNQCDKAFSRHDKLKHHVRKTHMPEYVGNIIDGYGEEDYCSIGLDVDSSAVSQEEPARITREDLLASMAEELPKEEIVKVKLMEEPSDSTMNTKKARGRPRKYPAIPRPLIKRPRGRPKSQPFLNQFDEKSENYDITNMPFGDLEYLTTPEQEENFEQPSSVESNYIEPLVEIEMDQNSPKEEKPEPKDDEVKPEQEDDILKHKSAGAFLQNIGLLENSAVSKMEIGECTISVSNGPGFT